MRASPSPRGSRQGRSASPVQTPGGQTNGDYSPEAVSSVLQAGRAPPQDSPRQGARTTPIVELVVEGFRDEFNAINGPYTPMGERHRDHQAWTHRNPNLPCVIFHTGKKRWVISKDLDEGSTCFAYVQDDQTCDSPAQCRQPWHYFNGRSQQWEQDSRITCRERAVESDPFLRLKDSLDQELAKVGVTDVAKRAQLWRKCDVSGDGFCDLLEVEAMIRDLTKTRVWPEFLNCDTEVIARAFAQTLDDSMDGDVNVDKDEFHQLLSNLFWFAKLHSIYSESRSVDQELNKSDFKHCMDQMGVSMSVQEVDGEWSDIDRNGTGTVDFEELCLYMARRVTGFGEQHKEEADSHKQRTLQAMKQGGEAATMGGLVKKKNFADFDKLEKQIKVLCAESSGKGLTKLWRIADLNNNNLVALDEVDNLVSDRFPILNHKPALLLAFQDSKDVDAQGGQQGDGVEKKEFKLLLANIFYYNKLFWLFDQAGQAHDRRMDFEEFQWCLTMTGMKMSQVAARAEFDKITPRGGPTSNTSQIGGLRRQPQGQILFEDFCRWFVEKHCPKAMMVPFVQDE